MVAGLLNVVWPGRLVRGSPTARSRRRQPARGTLPDAFAAAPYRLLLAASLLTGAASFIYEIGWIRMLSLVLGSSTHAFELMLSAFILGLASAVSGSGGGSSAGRTRAVSSACVQMAMGVLALATLPVYGRTFP